MKDPKVGPPLFLCLLRALFIRYWMLFACVVLLYTCLLAVF